MLIIVNTATRRFLKAVVEENSAVILKLCDDCVTRGWKIGRFARAAGAEQNGAEDAFLDHTALWRERAEKGLCRCDESSWHRDAVWVPV